MWDSLTHLINPLINSNLGHSLDGPE